MRTRELREEVFRANLALADAGLVVLTWGNASGIDHDLGLVAIKPSGVSYAALTPENLVVVDLDGNIVEGSLRPSSDLPTHLELYRAWSGIGGVVHTHSIYGTAFAQAASSIPCYGTTHADFCPGGIPCVRALTEDEVDSGYEGNAGKSIIEHYREKNLKPLEYPGALLSHHGPFAWGKNAAKAAENALILESVAKMAFLTRELRPDSKAIPGYIVDKHYLRKHGPNAYYGQN
ncbi:MAG: L-ribulose-5-phosphate 4-epimerase AraD [Planctomycetota bacterium]|jgi:L-ribulose-5-phosphate 4-epimerase|nr:L-ribulose-5-phosphate 4-epimerase AraD [Planctomycetota bacterium]